MPRLPLAFAALAAVLLLAVAAGSPPPAAALPPGEQPARRPPPPPEPERGTCLEPGDGAGDVRVRWGTPRSTQTCFFFSGPFDLGRDDHLGDRARLTRRGDQITLAFGAHAFEGTARDGRVRMTRRSTHQYGGAWRVTEVIEGRLTTGRCPALRLSYRYQECHDAPGAPCPGTCTIEAPLTVSR